MGIELRIRGTGGDWPPTVVSPETFLSRLVGRTTLAHEAVVVTATGRDSIELRRPTSSSSGMPDVVVTIEERGFYLLDHCGSAALADLVMSALVRYLLGYYGSVTVEEL